MTELNERTGSENAAVQQALGALELFAGLDATQLEWVAQVGRLRILADGDVLFHDGETANAFFVLLEGELLLTKVLHGQEQVLSRHRSDEPDSGSGKPPAANQFTGEVPLLNGSAYVATATAVGATRVVAYDRQNFFAMLDRCPQVSRVLLPVVAWRIHAQSTHAGRATMLHGLETLASGLAHELNNPVAVTLRSASELQRVIRSVSAASVAWGATATGSEQQQVTAFVERVRSRRPAMRVSPLAAADLEDALDDWLGDHEITLGDQQTTSLLAEHGVTGTELDQLAAEVRPECLGPALSAAGLGLYGESLAEEAIDSGRRIESLVSLIKAYTNMDRTPEREVDLHEGLDATLTLLDPGASGIEVVRRYAELPAVRVHVSEINQVWLHLITNAIEAMPEGGTLEVVTQREGQCIVVDIRDTGVGIPEDVLPQIFQPFFTTKDVGQGAGLGLHLSRDTVSSLHNGSIEVSSLPGNTLFRVRIPMRSRPEGR